MRVALFLLFFTIVCTYAFKRGGAVERAVAGVLVAMLVVDMSMHLLFTPVLRVIDAGHFAIDLAAWIAFFVIALRAARFWPLCISALQTVTMASHLARVLDISVHPVAYGIMQVASSWPMLLVLALGTVYHQRRVKMTGNERSWLA